MAQGGLLLPFAAAWGRDMIGGGNDKNICRSACRILNAHGSRSATAKRMHTLTLRVTNEL